MPRKITINPTMDMETFLFISNDGTYWWDGAIVDNKGDSTAQAAEQQQQQFDSQLMGIFQSQYGNQTNTLNFLKGQLQPIISKGGQGYSPQDLAAMRTQATDNLSQQFQGAQKAINATEQRGLPSGVNAQVSGSLMAQEAEQQAAAQNEITQANESLKNATYWQAINALNGNAVEANPLGYASSATSGNNAVSNLSQAVTAANGPTFGQIAGGIIGGGLQGWATGGFKV